MRLRAQKFLLFSFAFSSALIFAESLENPVQTKNGKTASESFVRNTTREQIAKTKDDSFRPTDFNHGLDKRSAEVFPEIVGEEEGKKQALYNVNPEKRTRLGFTGMRGKKEFSTDDYCARILRARLEGALNKRFYRGFNELLGGKRASLAFHGMRGKKSQDYDAELLEPEAFDSVPRQEFLMSSGLMDDPEEMAEVQEDTRPEEDLDEEMLSKRSPYAFQGMRGKKESAYDLKRAMGFLGMRGKKATEVWDAETNYKRAPQTSFFGMKGKKAQSSGFFGMRGKKASPNAFFGVKGKRDPVDYDLQDLSSLNQVNESEPSRNRYRRGIAWWNNSKKGKNAFFGVRGKKSTGESE